MCSPMGLGDRSFGQRLRGDHREHQSVVDDRQRQAHDTETDKTKSIYWMIN